MGLLKGAGRELKGLLRSGELADTFAEAQAWLDGDYGNAMKLTERDLARRRARREARRRAEEEARRARMLGHAARHPLRPDEY
ncbi:MAG TPA: hypothetical protein VIT45_01585 [Allosphingosinicella sp.]